MEYKFKIQYCAEGTQSGEIKPAEVMLECAFDAPSEDHADQFAAGVEKLYSDLGLVVHMKRVFEAPKEWMRRAVAGS